METFYLACFVTLYIVFEVLDVQAADLRPTHSNVFSDT